MPYNHPFTKDSADVVLRSSDGSDFRVHKLVLSEASCVFEGMFSLPQSSDTSDRQTPGSTNVEERVSGDQCLRAVVVVPESSRTLDLLLRHCYPMSRPTLTDLQEVITLLESMKKYAMDDTAEEVRNVLLQDRFSRTIEDAFAVYAAIWRLEIKQSLGISARATFRFRLPTFASPILQSMSPASIFALLEFRGRCVDAATDFVNYPRRWEPFHFERWAGTEHEQSRSMELEDPRDDNDYKPTRITVDYGCRICIWRAHEYTFHDWPQPSHMLHVDAEDARDEFLDLTRERPCGLALKESVVLRKQLYGLDVEDLESTYHYGSPRCPRCIVDGAQTVSEVLQHLSTELDAVLMSVSALRLYFDLRGDRLPAHPIGSVCSGKSGRRRCPSPGSRDRRILPTVWY